MPTPALSDDALREAVALLKAHGGTSEAAAVLGIPRGTFAHRIRTARARGMDDTVPTHSELPPEDLPFDERLETMKRRNALRIAHQRAQAWQTVRIPIDGPYGLCFFGDPHLDDPYCDLEAIERHASICADTEGLFGVNGGDSVNNWVGYLKKLYADQPATASEGWELVEWFMNGLGIRWALWLLGNHDAWEMGKRIFEKMNCQQILMRDWDARIRLLSPDGAECRLWARHNFKGTSIYNELHGLKRAAMFTGGEADILASFHLHTFGTGQAELENGRRVTMIRAKGYKECDQHAVVNGFAEGMDGQSVVTVVTPRQGRAPLVSVFDDVAEGAEFLAYKRRKLAA